ncbi:hypothetical protein UF75_2584 [Desulfosporosinus sp. I2]|nr:hypothetical protein UF75_2584 [Desulfosporosinus sp. I2]
MDKKSSKHSLSDWYHKASAVLGLALFMCFVREVQEMMVGN